MQQQNSPVRPDSIWDSSEFTCTFHVQLDKNIITPVRLNEEYQKKYLARLRQNPDYRQLMLSSVLSRVVKEEKDRLIQALLPERLMQTLTAQDSVQTSFHTTGKTGSRYHRLDIRRLNATPTDVFFGFVMNLAEEAPQKSKLGCRGILLVGDDGTFHSLLDGKYPLFHAQTAQEAETILHGSAQSIAVILAGPCADDLCIRSLIALGRTEYSVVISTSANAPTSAVYLGLGAYDLLQVPCSAEEIHQRLDHLFALQDASAMLRQLETDPVTGMYSREFFLRKADELLAAGETPELVCFSIENFQILTERYGDTIGNMVLQHVSTVIAESVPDILLRGRISDDEIAVLRKDTPHVPYQGLQGTFRVGSPLPNLLVKIGYVKADGHSSVQALFSHAEAAISEIRQQYGVYAAEYNEALAQKKGKELRILGDMEAALEKNQFQIYYQPKHLAATGTIGGSEALIRWIHPEYGFLPPDEFIPLFEKVGFIRGLDRYVAARVCRDLKRWQAMGLPLVPVSINLSRRDFETGDLADWLIGITNQMGLERSLLHLEITESAFTDTPELITDNLCKLHQAGFVIELDDFGSGYSSLIMLNNMDIDIMKIDKSIVQQNTPGSQRDVLEFCLRLAKLMKLKTVAEGVETAEQLQRLAGLGCDYIQGYYYSRPLPLEQFEQYLRCGKF